MGMEGRKGRKEVKLAIICVQTDRLLLMDGNNHEAHGTCEMDGMNRRNEVMASRTTHDICLDLPAP